MYSPSFIASEAASAQEAVAAGRYDIAERKFSAVSSFVSFNVAVSRVSAGDTTGRSRVHMLHASPLISLNTHAAH